MAPVKTQVDQMKVIPFNDGIWTSIKNTWECIRISLFVIGGALLLFAGARNTLTWHLQKFWGASGDFWQRQWGVVYNFCDKDPFIIGVWGTTIVSQFVFWGFNTFWIILDLTGKPQCLLKYKIQPKQNMPLSPTKFKKAVKWVLFNQMVVGLPFLMLTYYAYEWRGCSFGPELPTFHWVLFELGIFSLVEEVNFYYSHRLLHRPAFYQRIHKMHHEYTAPIGIRSVYAHPIEHIISNLLGPMLGPFLLGSHIATAWLWFTVALMSTTVSHCGYHFPFLFSPEAHDFHHQKFINNFGVLGILDWVHGTDNLFRKSKAYERHIFLTSLTPVSELFPDEPKASTPPPPPAPVAALSASALIADQMSF